MRSAPILLALAACAHGGPAMIPLRTVGRVDLARYAGTWYEIAAIPQRFQKGCVATTATYTLRPDGEEKSAKGRAWVVDPETNARLKVTFFWPFRGDYWIVDLDPEYRWAVVGHPDRTYGWILSRTPAMDEETYQGILGRLREQAYDTGLFVRTLQPAG